jgi:hypothetical protein
LEVVLEDLIPLHLPAYFEADLWNLVLDSWEGDQVCLQIFYHPSVIGKKPEHGRHPVENVRHLHLFAKHQIVPQPFALLHLGGWHLMMAKMQMARKTTGSENSQETRVCHGARAFWN